MASRPRNSTSSPSRSPSPEKSLGLTKSSPSSSTEQLVASLSGKNGCLISLFDGLI